MSESAAWKMSIVGQGEVDPWALTLHPENPKVHPEAQDRVVSASLGRWGWLQRVTVNRTTGHLLDGEDRVLLARRRGEKVVPVQYVEVEEADEGAVLMTLDASAQLARVHEARWAGLRAKARPAAPELAALWAQMAAGREGVGHAGEAGSPETGGGRADAHAAEVDGIEQSEAAGRELVATWGVEAGQVWACGAHRVWCGDVTEPAGWAVLREQVGSVAGCFTSPPYAMQRASRYGGVPPDSYRGWFLPIGEQIARVLRPDGSWFLNLQAHQDDGRRAVYVHALVVDLVERGGWVYLDEYMWPRPGVPCNPKRRGTFKNQWEPVFWFARQERPVFYPERAQHRSERALHGTHWGLALERTQGTGVDMLGEEARRGEGWAYPGNRLPGFGTGEALGQAAAFPVELPQWFMPIYSDPDDWWLDPFGGSGSTLLACERTGRRGWLMERDPVAVAITLQRWREATGVAPRRAPGNT